MAVVATLTKGYDLDYIWRQVDPDLIKDAASYYIQATESGGEPPGRWWGPGAKALGLRIIEYPAPDAQGTTFVLPWARDPDSEFRRRTGTAAIDPADPGRLIDTLIARLPTAMLFLRRLREVEVLRDGESLCRYVREDADDICQITGEDGSRVWLMLHGDFAEDARALRGRFPGKIEDRRRADVMIAVPVGADVDGLLCAYLPTDERSGLAAHVNADFYPESDRRHLITDSFHGEWNRLAVRAAARVLAARLPSLATRLGHEQLWRLIYAAYEAGSAGADTGIAAYWDEIGPVLPSLPVMWTTSGKWTKPASTVLLHSADEDEAIPVLERLGILVAHPQVGAFIRRMSGWAGARMLTAGIVAQILLDSGLTAPATVSDAPAGLTDYGALELLWKELNRLLSRSGDEDRSAAGQVAVMPGADGRLWPAAQLRRADADTMRMMADLGLNVAFLDQAALPEGCVRLVGLCPLLDLRLILSMLSSDQGKVALREALGSGRVTAASLLTWLRRDERVILADAGLRELVRKLPAYPAGGSYRALDEVVMPGGFSDRLGIADAIDCEQIGPHEDFLRELGAEPLSLRAYLTKFVPVAASQPGLTDDPHWQQLVADLAGRLDELAKDAEVREALLPLPLVLCDDGEFRSGASCYFPGESVAAALGRNVPKARELAGHELSTATFYEWLGVARDPRLPDVVSRVRLIAADASDPPARTAVADVIGYLGKLIPDRRTPVPEALDALRGLAWLPVRGDDAWHAPPGVNSVFREQLFATQGRFLDVPLGVQQSATAFLSWLGVESNPSVSQVVAHLLTRARQHEPVSRDVYAELNRNYDDPSVLRLRNTACLLMADGSYARPEAVYRQANPFGRFRQRLGPDFDAIGNLLDALGVKRVPDHEDARAVLADIAREQEQRFHTPVDDPDDLAVIWHCWQMLDESLTSGSVNRAWFTQLSGLTVIPDDSGVLTPPSRLLIDDMPGVASALNVGRAVIRRKEGMWRAFQAAGVRSLTEAVEIEILQMGETGQAGTVHACIHQRTAAIGRILDGDPTGLQRLTTTLGALEFPETSLLRVRYHLPTFGLVSPETDARALYVPAREEGDGAQLISCLDPDGTWPWMLIAKELARALYPGEAPGLLSSSLYVVLNAQSLDAAHRALDDAGLPQLEHVDFAVTDAGPGARFADYSDDTDEHDEDPTATSEDAHSGLSDQQAPVPSGKGPAVPDQASESPDDELTHDNETDPGDDAPGRADSPEHPHHDDASSGRSDRPAPPKSDSADGQKPRGRLRSYVNPGPRDDTTRNHPDTSPVDAAGIERVVRAERAAGRHPEVMRVIQAVL